MENTKKNIEKFLKKAGYPFVGIRPTEKK